MAFKIVFTADLHGNSKQYSKLFKYAKKENADYVIIGGDITPNNFKLRKYVEEQRKFLQEKLPTYCEEYLRSAPGSKIYLMMGNDDCKYNEDILDSYPNLFQVVNQKRIKLQDGYDIYGYSYIPITPFNYLKDWEKNDLSKVPQHWVEEYSENKIHCIMKGLRSNLGRLESFELMEGGNGSIQADFETEDVIKNAEKTVYVIHTPPYQTFLDMLHDGKHAGSFAVREFIELNQPLITLHGHIHETVDVSGKYYQKLGNTTSVSAGNDNQSDNVSLVDFDLPNLDIPKRIII